MRRSPWAAVNTDQRAGGAKTVAVYGASRSLALVDLFNAIISEEALKGTPADGRVFCCCCCFVCSFLCLGGGEL